MMLCVISYWVLSGAPQAADLAAPLLRAHPTKTLKWRDVYLKLTRHNGRAGKYGTYNPKHNDRNFDLINSEHIDPERAKSNIYWDCFHGFRSALDPQDPDDLGATFSDVERQFYESRYSNFVESQNERNAKIRHTERNRSIPDLLSSRKTCPEETIYQLGTLDEHASAEDLLNLVTEFIEEFKARFGDHVHVLNWALHLDESTPHIHERHVFDCENKYGEVAPQQEKALEALGFDLPDPGKPLSRRNNRKITFDASCRKMLFEIAKRHGLDLEEEAEYGNRKYLEKQDFILAKQKEQLFAQQNRLDELTLKVNDMETLLDDVSAAAYDKAVEVVTDVVRTETRKEDMRMIEDTKRWVLSPERKAPKATREYTAKHLDTVLDKFLKTMQTTATRLQEKLMRPDVRQKGREQVKEKARDSVLQLLSRLQAEQARRKSGEQHTAEKSETRGDVY
ncbi:plasmid recombination protein [Faecalibacterium longum]|uniref:Plasmid recombination protein n=1 Tax=Faecalibacterium longum TaxID=1851428 RepID=A0ABV1IP60_9FIRM|nr:plasmid recombination protein [Faecalibacterium longum]MCC2181822.1 plasmid recombination protein [Faecalibacterium longum CLA-AA-H236]